MATPEVSGGAPFGAILRRDLTVALRHRGDLVNPLLFFVIVVSLFPLGVGSEAAILRQIAPGVIWVAALLATLLALDGLFRTDFEDGSLEQLLLSPHPVSLLVLAKVVAHWLVTGLPLIIVAPLLAVLMRLPGEQIPYLLLSLALGTPTLSLIGAIGVALTVSVRRGGVLVALLVLPLYVPVLIFGANLLQSAAAGLATAGQTYWLAAILVLALTLAPPAIGAALRVSMD